MTQERPKAKSTKPIEIDRVIITEWRLKPDAKRPLILS